MLERPEHVMAIALGSLSQLKMLEVFWTEFAAGLELWVVGLQNLLRPSSLLRVTQKHWVQ